MKIVPFIDLNLVYVWVLLKQYINEPDNLVKRSNLLNFLTRNNQFDSMIYDYALSFWYSIPDISFINNIKENLLKGESLSSEEITFLISIKIFLEDIFKAQLTEIVTVKEAKESVEKTISVLKSIKTDSLHQDKIEIIDYLRKIAVIFFESINSRVKNELLDWDELSIFLILEGYGQFFCSPNQSDVSFTNFELFYRYFSTITSKNLKTVYVVNNEDNIIIEPTFFPDKIHLKILNLLDYNLNELNKLYVFNSIDENIVDNPLYITLFAHELGHILDRHCFSLEQSIVNDLYNKHPDFVNSLTKENFFWIKEIIADAVAVCLAGPSYLCALLSYFKNQEMMQASEYYPSFAYRTKIIYTYLIQNEFDNLFRPDVMAGIKAKLEYYQQIFSVSDDVYTTYENILQGYMVYIYKMIIEFFRNTKAYLAYEDILEIVCSNDGNLVKAQQKLEAESIEMKDFLILQNINWLIRLENIDCGQKHN